MRHDDASRPPLSTLASAYAWGAGTVFVASLGYFLYFYFVRLGRAAGAGGPVWPAVAVDTALVTLFAAHHSVMARSGAKHWLIRHLPAPLERATFVWVASLLLVLVCAAWRDLPGELYRVGGAWAWAFRLVQLAGLAAVAGAARALHVFDLAGIRQVRAARRPGPAPAAADTPGERLEAGGAYRLVRHPVYLGWNLLLFAEPAMTVDRLLFATLALVYLVVAIPLEERSLGAEFGAAYAAYRAKVRWRMIPGVY
jgi:protein-S-isoprenylcysteine O-methyltransferase Ste14